MEWFQAVVLGLVQGLTEFLPVSSSGHLTIFKAIFGIEAENLSFEVAVHAATVVSTIVAFRKEIWDIIGGVFKFKYNSQTQYFLKICVSMIPVFIVGVFFKDFVTDIFGSGLIIVGAMLLLTAVLLFVGEALSNRQARKAALEGKEPGKEVGYKEAFIIGIGQAFALNLAREGARVVAADILEVADTVEKVKAAGGEITGINVDVSSAESTRNMASETVEKYGTIDVMINNAAIWGGLKFKPMEQIAEEEWDAVFAVNVMGIWQCCKAVVPYMKERGKGSIINISSASILQGIPLLGHYVASKGAIWAYTRSLSREIGEFGIRVNSLSPGYTMTQASKNLSDDQKLLDYIYDLNIDQRIIKRAMEPEDLIGALLFLASDDSAFITGQNINVDGGSIHY